ncbi:hypothetical protein [Streptomyces sp. NPDC096339]|uniref:hypothetical protein n=1 Tax=Streptomyces sp. NPDC096339 TaxID=3366086 RepID=UPI0038236B2F
MPTAAGWAVSVVGVGCGRPDPGTGGAERAKSAAVASVTGAARERHGVDVGIDREPLPGGARAGQVREGVTR